MPKMKTNSSAKKRFKTTGTGKLTRNQSGMRHNLGNKQHKTKKKLGGKTGVHKADAPRVMRMLTK